MHYMERGAAIATDLLKVIISVINLWLSGRCPSILAEFVASASLTPLLKPDNGIRPIAVGTIWRRLVSKVAMKGVGKEMSKYLSDFQFEVGVSGDAEAILHSVNRVLSEYHNDRSLAMLTVDFSNAFNLVDRSALLHELCKTRYFGGRVWSEYAFELRLPSILKSLWVLSDYETIHKWCRLKPVHHILCIGDIAIYFSNVNRGTFDRRATPIAIAWRHHDSSVADPFPGSNEYNASDVAKLWEVVISLRRPPLGVLYVAGLSNVWKHAGRAFSLKYSEEKVITMAEFLRLPNLKGCKISAGALLPPGTTRVTHLASLAERLEDVPPKIGDMMVAEIPCRKVLDDMGKKKRKAEEKVAAKVPAANIQAGMVVNKDAGRDGTRKKWRVHIGPQVQTGSKLVSSLTPLNHAKPLETLAKEEHVSPPLSAGHMDALRDQTDEHATPPGLLFPASRRLDTVEEPAHENVVPKVETNEYFFFLCFFSDRLEELEEDKKEVNQLNSSQADRIKQLEEALKQSEADAHQLRVEKECYVVKAGKGEMDTDIQAILKATPNVDPASSDIFMDAYKTLFDQMYPYVDKVARMYLLDPSDL
nr:putative reverse transcriptase domain-containing protein [Tanacetum cinerariifolium]